MEYVEYTPFFCAATETIKDTVNNTMNNRGKAPNNLLEILTETPTGDHNQLREEREPSVEKPWNNIPAQAQNVALAHVEVYQHNFIGIVQGTSTEWRQNTHHFSYSTDEISRTNNPLDVVREDPISLKELTKGEAKCKMQKTGIVWAINTAEQVLTLPQARREYISSNLANDPPRSVIVSKRK